jgi:glycine cleavage system T protein
MERSRAVVIGGGITGCSVAYHIAKAGWSDVTLLEKGELTSGSTAHAAGLVTAFNPSATMMRFRSYSIDLYKELGVFESVGSLRIASSLERLKELRRGVSRARGIGLEVGIVSAEEAVKLMPAASPERLFGAVWVPQDGFLDPHTATHALAKAARDLGATVKTGSRVTGIELGKRGEVTAVVTDAGRIECEVVVNAAGLWAPRLAAMAGAFAPSTPVDHQHIALKAVDGHEMPKDMPCFRDPDNLVYGKSEQGGAIVGGYESNPAARWIDGAPWEHGGSSLPPDMERFEPLLRGAARRFPFMANAEIIKLVCHPDAMTPDANPLLGPVPGTPGLFMAAGLSLNGFGGAGGIGKAVAEWITEGETELDVTSYRAWRFGGAHRDAIYAAEQARESYKYYYLLRYPFDQDEWGRPKTLSAVHTRHQDLGCVFAAKNAWERADHYEPGRPWRRAGADQREYGWSKPTWFGNVAAEHEAVRERVALVDLSSFGKIEASGPGALALLEKVCDNKIDRPVGSVVYTQFLDAKGGIVGDVTVTRLGADRFRIVTGAASIDSDLGWLRANETSDGQVRLRDTSEELSVIGLWGPKARDVLGAATDDDVSNEAIPYLSARPVSIGGARVLAQRVTYVGELGFEIYVLPGSAVQVWDRLWSAGASFEIAPAGYRALDSLRMEKGYKSFGTDLTARDNPWQAGLGFCVDLDKPNFNGRDALVVARDTGPDRTLRTLVIGDADYLTIYGGEAVHAGGEVSRLTSAAYGFTVRRNIGYVYLPAETEIGASVEVEVFGDMVGAVVVQDALHDPYGARVRG